MQVQTLLAIAVQPGITTEDLRRVVVMSQSSASRNTRALGKWRGVTDADISEPGADYVESMKDPRESRRKIHFLTPRGKAVVQKAIELNTGRPCGDFDPQTYKEWWARGGANG
jgi:DNA-binding MarR family transcriptional regulator